MTQVASLAVKRGLSHVGHTVVLELGHAVVLCGHGRIGLAWLSNDLLVLLHLRSEQVDLLLDLLLLQVQVLTLCGHAA